MLRWLSNRRSRIRWGIGLLLLPWSIVSAALFLYTSGPVPKSFRPWEQLGCLPRWSQDPSPPSDSKSRFLGFIEGGSLYATLVGHNFGVTSSYFDVSIVDSKSNRTLCALSSVAYAPHVLVSPNRQFVLLQIPWFYARLYQLRDGKLLRGESMGSEKAVFDSSGDQLLMQNLFKDDCILHLTGNEFSHTHRYSQIRLLGRLLDFYFDREDRPKALVVSNGLVDLVDIASLHRDWSSAKAAVGDEPQIGPGTIPDTSQSGFVSSNKTVFFTNHNSLGLCVRSLRDGSVLGIHKLAKGASLLNCSPDGRFLLYVRPPDLGGMKRLRKLSSRLEKWLDEFNAEKKLVDFASELCLLDVESGETWSGMNIDNGTNPSVAFREADQTFLTAGDNGVYEWDLPTRYRWFTPWAWPALAVWLILAVAWRRLKIDRTNSPLSSPIP